MRLLPAFKFYMTPINRRRWLNFKANKRGYWSLWLFLGLFTLSLFAEFIANDRPLLVTFKGEVYAPVFVAYPETEFGGFFQTEADFRDPFVQDLIKEADGTIIWPVIRYDYRTINLNLTASAPSPPSRENWLGTDDQARDVMARMIYGFRISVLFGLVLTIASSVIGVAAGAVQGYFVVRAEFLRGRNFEYVKAARALGLADTTIMFRHLLPNAMVATLTFMPFILNSSITTLTSLDFLGYGLPPGSPSLGELLSQGKSNLQAPWLGFAGFFSIAIMLSLLVFIGEAVRDAFDPRKVLQ